jgi:hypothetical protein
MKAKTRRGINRRDRRLAKASQFKRLPRKAGRVAHGSALPIERARSLQIEKIPATRAVARETLETLRVPLSESLGVERTPHGHRDR